MQTSQVEVKILCLQDGLSVGSCQKVCPSSLSPSLLHAASEVLWKQTSSLCQDKFREESVQLCQTVGCGTKKSLGAVVQRQKICPILIKDSCTLDFSSVFM